MRQSWVLIVGIVWCTLGLGALGCGGDASDADTEVQPLAATSAGGEGNQQAAPQPLVVSAAPATAAGADSPFQTGIGRDREHPVPTCGAMESYIYVASTYQCPGGGNPLGGNPSAGQAARIGNVGPHAGAGGSMEDAHIVDLYSIPCPAGAQELYVCLYHCPRGRSPYGR